MTMRLNLKWRGPVTRRDAWRKFDTTARLLREAGRPKPVIRIAAKRKKTK